MYITYVIIIWLIIYINLEIVYIEWGTTYK